LQHRQGATSVVGDLVREEVDDRLAYWIAGRIMKPVAHNLDDTAGAEVIDDDGDAALPRTVLLGDGGPDVIARQRFH
jgi:hypothetical protein